MLRRYEIRQISTPAKTEPQVPEFSNSDRNVPSSLLAMSSGGAFPLLPSGDPVQSPTTPPPYPTQGHLSSPVKSVAQPFAAHKREEVQNYGYDKSLHQLKDYETIDAFLKFLGVSEDILEANAKPIGKESTTASGQPEGSGRSSGKRKGEGTGSDGMAFEESTDFSRKNFVRVANVLAKSMKNKYFANAPLLVFKSTENKVPRGHVTDTECRPDFTAAFDTHWGDEATTLWPCIRLVGEDASLGKSKKSQTLQAISYLHYLLLARPDLHVGQGLLISKRGITFLVGIGGRGIRRFSVAWTDTQLYKLMYAFVYRLYDPGHFADPSYVAMIPNLQENLVTYTIRLSEGDLVCPGFSPIYATSPFASRTHVLSNPFSGLKVDGKVFTVLKDQLCQLDRRFDEYGILTTNVHSPEKVPGVVEAVYHELIEIPVSLRVSRVKHRIGLHQLGSPITSIPTIRGMLEIVFDVLEVLRYLRVHRQVLHRDISKGNVLYVLEETTPAEAGSDGVQIGSGETKEVPLLFIKYLLGESTVPHKTSALLIDFNNAEHLGSKHGSKRTPRTGTPVFIARAVQQEGAVLLPVGVSLVPTIPRSPQIYTLHHPDRVKKFPFKGRILVEEASPGSVNRQWRHELDHDVESVFWLLLYWVVLAQPAQLGKEEINANIWTGLTGSSVKLRTGLLRSLCAEESLEELMHSVYQPLFPLLRNLAAILIVDRHWLDESEVRNDPEYAPEAFQRLILQFILDNRDEEFMTRKVEPEPREVEQVGQNPNLLSTTSSRRDENIRKRPSPRPSTQRQKRPRVAAEVVTKDASDEAQETDEEESDDSEYYEDDAEMATDSD